MFTEAPWPTKRLKFCVSYNDEVLPESTDDFETIEYVEISDVSLVDGVERSTPMLFHEAPSRARRRVRAGDILVSTVRTYLKAIAAVGEVPENLIASTGFCVIRPKDGVDPHYAGWVAKSEEFVGEVVARSVGVSYPAINASQLVDIAVPFPPIDIQQRIASFLNEKTAQIDALIEKKQALLERLAEKREAIITQAVTKGLNPSAPMKDSSIDWLCKIPQHWQVLPFGRSISRIEQGWSPQCEERQKDDDEWGVLRSGCVNEGIFRPDDHKTLPVDTDPRPELEVRVGDLLMCRASGSLHLIGSAALVDKCPPQLMFSDKTYRIRLLADSADPKFTALALSAKYMREQIVLSVSGAGGLANNIPQSLVKAYYFARPPLGEQHEIAHKLCADLKRMDEVARGIEDSLLLLNGYRSALISAAVTGQIEDLQ